MKNSAAVLWGVGQDWSVEEVELDGPRDNEVLVRLAASGLCHSDEHLVTGDLPVPGFPYIGGHEGAGEVVEVGPGVRARARRSRRARLHPVVRQVPVVREWPPEPL